MIKNLFKNSFFKIIFICFLVIFLKLPIIISKTPAVWDEANYLEGVINIVNNNLNPLTLYWSYHPPVFVWTMAIFYKLFGNLLLTSRIINVIWAMIAASFTLLLAEKLIGKKLEAFLVALLLVFSPIFMAQAGLIQLEIALTALTITTVYFYYVNSWYWLGLSASALVLTKESGLIIFLLIIIFEIISKLKDKKLNIFRLKSIKSISFILPLLSFLLWLQANKLVHGWYLWPYNWSLFTNLSSNLIGNFKVIYLPLLGFSISVYEVGYWSGVILALTTFMFFMKGKKIFKDKIIFLFVSIIIFFPLVFIFGMPLVRYLLPIYPLVFLLFGLSMSNLKYKKIHLGTIIMILFIPFLISFWHKNMADWEVNMNYLEMAKYHKKIAQLVKDNYSDSKILSYWPITIELIKPYLGYIDEGTVIDVFNIEELQNLSDYDYVLLDRNIFLNSKIFDKADCLILKEKIKYSLEEIMLYSVDKMCLR